MLKHKVRMLSTEKGVHDGELHPVAFREGEEYEIGPDLLQGFIGLGEVEMAGEGRKAPESGSDDAESDETKARGAAPANKMKKAAPENKSKA